jgi:1-deoxy-D-xylulose-5-phosphate reductoisomerase
MTATGRKRIAILGSTGSIGRSALDVAAAHPDRVEIVALSAGRNVDLLGAQVQRFRPRLVAMSEAEPVGRLRAAASDPGSASYLHGSEGMVAVATLPEVDLVLCASSGTAALEAVLAAIESGKTVALANKEILVMAGSLMTEAARRRGVTILPVDSEHNAIHQCLHGRRLEEIRRIVLTASGGPFLGRRGETLEDVGVDEALRHPTWRMGRKITIDSATLMNKGLEVIEAHYLFDAPASRIDVVIHPQSVVHSMVELRDGSVIAQLGITDMRLPIQYAFSYPDRWDMPLPTLDFATCRRLDFDQPDHHAFPCLGLAYRALSEGGGQPVVLNAANEVAVAAFLDGRLSFMGIPRLIERTMNARRPSPLATLAEVRAVDDWAREYAQELARDMDFPGVRQPS